MIQSALNVGTLVTWTKSFNCPGVVGTDAVEHLNSAIKRQGGSLAQDIEVVGEWLTLGINSSQCRTPNSP